jgi:hypothetical protein
MSVARASVHVRGDAHARAFVNAFVHVCVCARAFVYSCGDVCARAFVYAYGDVCVVFEDAGCCVKCVLCNMWGGFSRLVRVRMRDSCSLTLPFPAACYPRPAAYGHSGRCRCVSERSLERQSSNKRGIDCCEGKPKVHCSLGHVTSHACLISPPPSFLRSAIKPDVFSSCVARASLVA